MSVQRTVHCSRGPSSAYLTKGHRNMGGLWDFEEEEQLPESNYFVFLTGGLDKFCARISSGPKLPPRYSNWMTGRRIDVDIPEPLIYEIDPEDEGKLRPFFREPGAQIMSNELIVTLQQAGVSNLDTYNAIVRETRTGREYLDYKVVNIVGLVSGADLQKSKYSTSGLSDDCVLDLWFEKLVLDEDKLAGHLFFRLAENASIVLMHRAIVDIIKSANIPGREYLLFLHPGEFSG